MCIRDSFYARFSSKRRNVLRREIAAPQAQGVEIRTLRYEELARNLDEYGRLAHALPVSYTHLDVYKRQIQIDPAGLRPYFFASTEPRPNRVLLFALAPALRLSDIPTFVQNHEVSERGVIFGTQGLDPLFAFALHLKVATRFFEERGIVGPHQFQRI